MRYLAPALVAALLLAPRFALADDAADSAHAMQLFHNSADAYKAGHFDDAIALLKQAYALKQEPILLYNLARAYEGVGDLENAVTNYRGYLAASPNADDRGAVEQRIATLDRQIAERDALRKKPEPARPKEEHRSPSAIPWIIAGVGGAGLIAGGAFGGLSLSSHSAATSDSQVTAQDDQSRAHTFATVANVCFIAGAVIVVVGVTWGVLDVRAANRTMTASASGMTFQW